MLYERLQKEILQKQRKPLKVIVNRSPSFFRKKKLTEPDSVLKHLIFREMLQKADPIQRDIRILQGLTQAITEIESTPFLQVVVREAVIGAIADFQKLPGANNFAVNKDEKNLGVLLQDFLENLTAYAGKLVSIQSAEAKRFHLPSFDRRIISANNDVQRHEEAFKKQFAKDAPRGYFMLQSPKSQRSLQIVKSDDIDQLGLHPTLRLLMMKHASQTDKSVSNIYDFYYDFVEQMQAKGVYFDIGRNQDGGQKRDFTLLKHSEYSAQIILTAHINNCLINNDDGSESSLRVAKNGEHLLTVEIVMDISSHDLGKTYQISLERFNYFGFDPVLAEKIEAINQFKLEAIPQQLLGAGQ
jgi:hypothetical protein